MALLRFSLFFAVQFALHIHRLDAGICQSNYTIIADIRRSTANKVDTTSGKPLLCDTGYIKDGTWYRFESSAGNQMPTTKPDFWRCGTYAPIWMDGSHPQDLEKPVSRKACANLPYVPPVGCGISYTIKVIKCKEANFNKEFYLYQLKEPRQCSLAYCAGSTLPVNCSTTGKTLPVCSGVVPDVTNIKAAVVEEESPSVRLKCVWEYSGNSNYVQFHVRWFGDEHDAKHKIDKKIPGTDKKEFLLEWEYSKGINSRNRSGYQFQKQVFCQVSAQYINGTWSKWKSSNRYFIGIKVYPQLIRMSDCGMGTQREVIITLRPQLPIRVKHLLVDISSPRQTTTRIESICVRGNTNFDQCGIKFQVGHEPGDPLRFKIMTTCPVAQTKCKQEIVEYRLSTRKDPTQSNKFWMGFYFNHTIKIIKTSNGKRKCTSTGDPHFTTFDGKYFDFYGRGTFTLYRNDHYGTEVQVRHRACGTTPSCNCGVAIKEHAFFKIYDMCHQDINQVWWKGEPVIRFSKKVLADHKLNRFYENMKSDGSSSDYEVSLPSGVVVSIKRMSWGLNLGVSAPIDIKHQSKGLCGNNNGKRDDDLKGKTPDEFGESCRVRTHKTLFDYTGDKSTEQQIDDRCNEKLCICEQNRMTSTCYNPQIATNNFDQREVLNKCFPSLLRNSRSHQKDSGIGECERKRRKRDLGSSADDTVDDQDVIPPFNPPMTNITFVPKWPTPLKGLTKTNVTSFCNKKLRYSKAGKTCGKITGVNIDTAVQQCITDIQITEDFSWSHSAYAALEADCITNVYKNESLYKNTTDGKFNVPIHLLASICPGDCSDHGTCQNSTCTCDEDYTAADCSIALKDRPVVFAIRKSGLCDVRRRPCRNVGIYGYPFLDSENLTCHVQEYKVIESVWTPQNTVFLYPGYLADLTEVKCTLPVSPINIGDYDDKGVTAAGLMIAISNNRINASEVSMKFITFDSVCQECNTTTGCKLKKDACFILGHCFAQNQSNPRDWCKQCLPEISTTSWTKRQYNQPPTFQTSTVLNAFYGKRLRVQLRANDPENRPLRFTLEQNSTAALLTENGFFTWIPTTNNSTLFSFKVYDECGLNDVLNALIVIKQCPCQNDGRCQPDSKDLSGSGNFTCSCNYGYNGTLCELDIDECLSSPCANGTCKNKKPGFSCSCNPGYTGSLCDIGIDECLASPCFLGVPCYDKINRYQCGPCPKGYSGNGEICNRNDGKIDECIRSPNICHPNATCTYNNESYTCQCVKGYSGDGKTNCTDINECSISPGVCHKNAICTNVVGFYSCQCALGYSGDGSVNCADINECSKSPSVCHQHGVCRNSNGSYSCQCALGYSGDGKINCADVNECIESSGVCHNNATCRNLKGSYSCQCDSGYIGDGIFNCTDINECSQSPAVCHQNAICTNTEGSYSCQCAKGFLGNGKVNCKDINECSKSPSVCHQHGVCRNSNGSYSCQCALGYSGDGKINCADVNECIESSGVCHNNATCRNLKGSYSCQCESGYIGDGIFNCTDINECSQSPAVCHQNAICTNTEGSYSCQCAKGFLGNGKVNCKENIPPRFTNPSKVYAILNKDFQIQIQAVDPENQQFTYSLLANGTIKNAQLSRDGLLKILVKKTGTVSIRVEDDLGGQRVLTLHVIAIPCPCKNGGECEKKKSSLYPEDSSDYICSCVAPYVGEYCGSRLDPCQELPCFPGLECTPSNDKFTCEECPKLFHGDGIKCELKSEAEKGSYKTKITLKNEEWTEKLTKKGSMTYKKLVSRITREIKKVYSAHQEFSYVIITGFRQGSVIVEFEMIFTKNVKDPLEPLQEAVKNGKLGNMTAEMEKYGNNEKEKEAKILGLDKTIFIVVVIAAGLLIILVSFVIYRQVKRGKTHRDAKLTSEENDYGMGTEAKGILFQSSKEEADNVPPGQEIGLATFENKAAVVDELQEIS